MSAEEEAMETETSVSAETDTTTAAQTTLPHGSIPEYAPIVVPPAPQTVAAYETDGPRLMITKIVNENFKSYAGMQTLGPFHKCFSSIIGPNGSGKSNVIDSMLFVFGYRANRIRSKKISVLLHNSEQHKDITSCTVSVHFQKIVDTGEGDDDYTVVPGSRFMVSRTAFKDNSSYYKINDKKATYKEVATCLRAAGIDLDHSRFLILQGEVEQIALMKPKALTEHDEGMLEFLEDLIGSSRFKEPIEMLTVRVEELGDLRSEKLNRVKAVEKEKDELEGSKNEAINYLKTENDLARKKNVLNHKYIQDCAEILESATAKRDEVAIGMKATTEKLDNISVDKKAKIKDHRKAGKELENLQATLETRKEEFADFEKQDVRCREDLKHAKGKAKKLDKAVEVERKKLEELLQIPEKMENDIVLLAKKQDTLEKEKEKEEEKLKEVMDSLKTETQGMQAEKDVKETELLGMQKSINDARSQLNVKQSELDLYLKNQQSEQKKLNETVRNLEKASTALKDRKSNFTELETRIPDTEAALHKARTDLQQANEEDVEITAQVKSTRDKVNEARSSHSAGRERGAIGMISKALLEEAKEGRIPGVYGRLGNLGAIDQKYDVAITTACGALDNIVVDNLATTGKKCVEFLKARNLGRATFLALDKQHHFTEKANSTIKTPDNCPRLFDLVRIKDDFLRNAFYMALRDTLVAKDMEQGNKIAFGAQRWRVVTMDGKLIETSGTMSGGGRPRQGGMEAQIAEEVDPRKLQDLENKLKKDSHTQNTIHESKIKSEEAVQRLTRELNSLKHSKQKTDVDLASLTQQETTLQKQRAEQEVRVKQAAPDENTLKQLEKDVEAYRKDFKAAQAGASGVEDQVHELHKQIMEIGGSKLKSAESKVNLVQNQIDQIMGHTTKANVGIKNAKRNAKKTEDKVTSMTDEIKETQESIGKLEAEFKQLEEDATKVLQDYQDAQDALKGKENVCVEIEKEINELEKQTEDLKQESLVVRNEIEKYDDVITKNKQKVKYWKNELSKITLNEVEGDDGPAELETLSAESLLNVSTDECGYEITVLEEKLARLNPNMAAIAEYKKKEAAYLKRVGELDKVTELRDDQRRQHEDLRKQRLDEFMSGFGVITGKLKEMYQMITLGGDAELELVDSLDPFSEGIVFSVRPPKKSWKNISNLSGGEKTLSSLALVFALHHYKPTPLYVMDEIDAALDFKNVSIVANYIKERTKNAQFIIISLRNNMFELADRLIGIYKTYNCTKSVTINPSKISIKLPEDADESMHVSGIAS